MTLRRATAPLLAILAALAVGACDNQGGGGGGGGGATQATAGDAIFKQAGCAGCHTLRAAQSTGTTGPNLDQLKPSADVVERQVRNGGGGMPSFTGRLSDQQIKAVAQYVSRSAGH
jgi:mono/diheme cytochrome c family protein